MTGRPPRDRDAELTKAEDALTKFYDEVRDARRKLTGQEADLLHRMFSSVPEAYDAWEYETR
jgi:hypothetical protein